MRTIKLTAKRQATFPAALCRELNVRPGDRLILERRGINGMPAWVIHPNAPVAMPWFGTLRRYAAGKSHAMADIRRTIGATRGGVKA